MYSQIVNVELDIENDVDYIVTVFNIDVIVLKK